MKKTSLKSRVLFFMTLFLSIFLVACESNPTSEQTYPETLNEYVYDEMDVVSQANIDYINDVNKELEEKTGAEVVVATVSDFADEDLYSQSVDMFNSWAIGDEEEDNGLLIVVGENESDSKGYNIEIRTGYGLEGALPDGKLGRILDNDIIPRIKDKGYDSGLTNGFDIITHYIAKEYNEKLETSNITTEEIEDFERLQEEESNSIWSTIIKVIILIVFVMIKLILASKGIYVGSVGFGGGSNSSSGGSIGGGGSTGGGGAGR